MVLADTIRNGKRSRGPSPNDQSSDLSSDEDSGLLIFPIYELLSYYVTDCGILVPLLCSLT